MELVPLRILIMEQEEVEIPLKVIEEVEEMRTILIPIVEQEEVEILLKVMKEVEEGRTLLRTMEELTLKTFPL